MIRWAHLVLGEERIDYLYGDNCVADIVGAIAARFTDARSAIFVLDRNVSRHAGPVIDRLASYLPVHRYEITPSEPRKRLAAVEDLLAFAVERGADRSSLIVAMGGGLVGNIAGLAAALLYRGVRLIHLPTTPVAAFDAVLSQKQAVNLAVGKNMCGAYHRPAFIGCDLRWLSSVPRRDLLTGVAELAKNVIAVAPWQEQDFANAVAALDDRPIAALTTLAQLGIDAKVPVLARDPRERHEALIFEYGHTVGHALEIVTAGRLSHGEAVAWGMLVAAEVSITLGSLRAEHVRDHHRVLSHLRLPSAATTLGDVDRAALSEVLEHDNKRGYLDQPASAVPMVLLSSLGLPVLHTDGRPLVAVPAKVVLDAFDSVAGKISSQEGQR
ncbi:3-dehydroquinate synthase family protein [Actinoplanes sp. CA-054009]